MSYKIYLTLIGLIMALLTSNCKTSMEKADSCDIVTGVCKPANLETLSIKNKEISNEEKSDMKLIYYFDALCGWCYGFSPVMSKVQEKYSGKLDIEVVSGGLFLGKRAGGVNEVAPHIKAGAYKSVERRTGVKFGQTFLEDVLKNGNMTPYDLSPAIKNELRKIMNLELV